MAVNLSKGQKISLEKEAGGALSQIKMGLGWDVGAAPQKSGGFLGGLFGGGGSGGGSIDLDASCIMLDANKQMVDAIWFGQLQSKDSSIQHTGDNRTGAGDGIHRQAQVLVHQRGGEARILRPDRMLGPDLGGNRRCRLVAVAVRRGRRRREVHQRHRSGRDVADHHPHGLHRVGGGHRLDRPADVAIHGQFPQQGQRPALSRAVHRPPARRSLRGRRGLCCSAA